MKKPGILDLDHKNSSCEQGFLWITRIVLVDHKNSSCEQEFFSSLATASGRHTSFGSCLTPLPSGRAVWLLVAQEVAKKAAPGLSSEGLWTASRNLVDPASCHMLVSRTKPCKCQSTRVSTLRGLCTAH